MSLRCFSRRLRFEPLETRLLLATFTVTNTLDSGAGSLRQAITDANASLDGGDIVFQIPATDPNHIDVDSLLTGGDAEPDVWRIQPLSALPAINNSSAGIAINGRSQTEFLGDQNLFGPEIVLDGNGVTGSGLRLTSNENSVSGLNIQRFSTSGILISGGDRNVIQGNYLGADATGTTPAGNGSAGVFLDLGAADNLIGSNADGSDDALEANVLSANVFGVFMSDMGTDRNIVAGNFIGTDRTGMADLGNSSTGVLIFVGRHNRVGGSSSAARNIISGNNSSGVSISASLTPDGAPAATGENAVTGNFIGTDVSGLAAVPNGNFGVAIGFGGSSNRIGTDGDGQNDAVEGNLISGNNGTGIFISGATVSGNIVAGNRIGTNAAGSAAISNKGSGVFISAGATGNRVGTNGDGVSDTEERNVIAGNVGAGLLLNNSSGNVVSGNSIGTDAAGVADLGNGADGVRIEGSAQNNQIGGPLAIGNTIAFNRQNGVELSATAGDGNTILGNSIHSNALFGIDLNADQITPNDDQDADTGPNRLQNTPEIVGTILVSSTMRVTYFVPTALANATYPLRVEFFLADADSHEGQTFLGADVFTAADFLAGSKSVFLSLPVPVSVGNSIVATATDSPAAGSAGNTSEFSVDETVGSNPWFHVSKPLDVDGDNGVFAADALDVINFLNAFGSVPVPDNGSAPPFLDANGDFFVTAADALDVINSLNAFGPQPPPQPEASGEAPSDSQSTNAVFAELGAPERAGAADLMALLTDSSFASRSRRSRPH